MDYLRIGRVLRPQGIRGEMKLQMLTEDPSRFAGLTHVFAERNGVFWEEQIQTCAVRGRAVYLSLAGIESREAAERLRNAFICVKRDDAIELPEGRWFVDDLIGCAVEDTNGRALGKLVDILQNGAADVYVIKNIACHTGLMVPALKALLHQVNIRDKRIVLDEGILRQAAIWDDQQGGERGEE